MNKLQGFMFPRSATGKSSIIPAPPWHYTGDILAIEYRTNPDRVAELLPENVTLDDDDPGNVAVIFADFQSCSDSFAELLDPVRSQYKECFFAVRCQYQGKKYTRCVYIWVNQDFAMIRGHHQGYPKKFGSIYMTRKINFGKAGPKLEIGGQFGATLAASDRRLITAKLTLTGQSNHAGFVFTKPMLHNRYLPSVENNGIASLDELVTVPGYDFESSEIWTGTAEINLEESPTEEFNLLKPEEMIGGYYRTVAFSWARGITLEKPSL
jgi:acetoacetate decarboxylase